MSPALRRTLAVLAVAFALASPGVQAWIGWGLDQSQFAAQGDDTLRAPGWAFSIWSVIYVGLIAHAAAQAFDHGVLDPVFAKLTPSLVAIAGCGAWIWASAADARWASVGVILASAAAAWLGLARAGRERRTLRTNLVTVWPIALLGGWLLTAAALNILTVMTAENLIAEPQRIVFAVSGILAVAALAIAAMASGVSLAYAIPVCWGLAAIFLAERSGKPAAAWSALAGCAAVALAAAVVELRRRART